MQYGSALSLSLLSDLNIVVNIGVYYLADSKIFFFNSDILYLVTPRIALEPIIANVRDVYQSNLHYNSLDPFYLAR